jgi:hypothetical protein
MLGTRRPSTRFSIIKFRPHQSFLQPVSIGTRPCLCASGQYQQSQNYQDFLAYWKDADPDVPLLRQAKAEYSQIQ